MTDLHVPTLRDLKHKSSMLFLVQKRI